MNYIKNDIDSNISSSTLYIFLHEYTLKNIH